MIEDKRKDCTCEDWKKGQPQVDGAWIMSVLHHGPEYEGSKYRYCPWCGKGLEVSY